MKAADLDKVVELTLPHLQEAGYAEVEPDSKEMDAITKLVSLYKDEISYGAEIVDHVGFFFNETLSLDDKSTEEINNETAPVVIQAMHDKLAEIPLSEFVAGNIKPLIKEIQKETGIKGRKLFMPIRIATTGQMHGPELADAIEVLGKEKALNHITQVQDQMA